MKFSLHGKFRQLVVILTQRKLGFDSGPVHVRYVVALGQVFLRALHFSSVTVIPQILHTHFDTCTVHFCHLQFNQQMHNVNLLYELRVHYYVKVYIYIYSNLYIYFYVIMYS